MVRPVPRIIAEGKTPADWVDELATHGLCISERTLRSRAKALGAWSGLGKAMVLLPEHIDRIFEGGEQCHSEPTDGAESGGSRGHVMDLMDLSGDPYEHATKMSRKPKSKQSNLRRGNVRYLDQTPQNQKTN